ncbi:MAG: hypothetical protein P9L92_10285 [Candidatus Electryonea clarkiae]|nr:hypothetical protein [Candidatus Electryonea clarkiae]MDP8285578.1 hypothetical protein [Candidatus Electryonea clarkiae]
MLEPTIFTWILIVFGLLTCGPLLYAQLIMVFKPHSEEARKLLIGKGEEWRDKSHFKSAYALAIADWILYLPVFIAGITGVILAQGWGYILFAAAGAIILYINIFLWFFEKEYVYPAVGPWAYYTYFWGNFSYWGFAALFYSILRLNGINF